MNGPLSASANERRQMPTAARAPRQPQTSRNFLPFWRDTASGTASGFKIGAIEADFIQVVGRIVRPTKAKSDERKNQDPPPNLAGGSGHLWISVGRGCVTRNGEFKPTGRHVTSHARPSSSRRGGAATLPGQERS